MDKQKIASDIAANYSMKYMLDRGNMPSQDKVIQWISKLKTLSEDELFRLGGDMNALKRFLSEY